jgi:hypothetical protein
MRFALTLPVRMICLPPRNQGQSPIRISITQECSEVRQRCPGPMAAREPKWNHQDRNTRQTRTFSAASNFVSLCLGGELLYRFPGGGRGACGPSAAGYNVLSMEETTTDLPETEIQTGNARKAEPVGQSGAVTFSSRATGAGVDSFLCKPVARQIADYFVRTTR